MNRPSTTARASRIVELTRVFDAPRERVFRAFVDPDLMAAWWGPDGFHTPRRGLTVEAHAGGRHEKTMVLDSAEIAAGMGVAVGAEFPDNARILEIAPPELLVLTSDAQPDFGLVERTITRIEFHAEGPARTRLVLIDGPYNEMMGAHAQAGWTQSLEKLARALAA